MIKVIAWDFDGVLNLNYEGGAFVWSRDFEQVTGVPLQDFHDHVFAENFHRIITGHEDVLARVDAWALKSGSRLNGAETLAYWFAKDNRPNPATLDLMARAKDAGLRQVIATNNEPRRTEFIRNQMGFGARVERIFASGHMGVRKPDAAYFAHITDTLGVAPADIILVDDREPNVQAAEKAGWRAYFYTPSSAAGLSGVLFSDT